MNYQKGIFEPAQKHATILSLDLADRAKAGESLENLWEDLSERLHDFYSPVARATSHSVCRSRAGPWASLTARATPRARPVCR